MARVMVLWFPRWAVVSALVDAGVPLGLGVQAAVAGATQPQPQSQHVPRGPLAHPPDLAQAPIVVVRANRVVDASESARADGVVAGLRLREAQGRCPQARVLRADDAAESRAFADVLDVLEQSVAGVEAVRAGLCVVPVRGPARFFGGEVEAVVGIIEAVCSGSLLAAASGVRVGVADDVFTAEQAAYSSLPSPVVVAQGRSRDFLDPLSIECLRDTAVVSLLQRLGVETLGDFGRLSADVVEARLGIDGAVLHARVLGLDRRGVVPRHRHEDMAARLQWDEPIGREDQLAFAVRDAVDKLVADLAQRRLVATAVRVEFVSDRGGRSDRLWSHPHCFDAAAIVDRVRWQLQSAVRGAGVNDPETGETRSGGEPVGLDGGIIRVVITPERVDEAFRFERPLFGVGVEDRVAQGLARVQGIVGHEGVLVARVTGGRSAHDRRVFVPWGDPVPLAYGDGPWPGRLPSPAPSIVYAQRVPASVVDAAGETVHVDERGQVSAAPAKFVVTPVGGRARQHRIVAWSGPWPVAERWWDEALTGVVSDRSDRFQCVDEEGVGWLLVREGSQWVVEGRYD